MFTSFKSAFKDSPLYKTEIPLPILKMLNESLPKGFKYVNIDNGFCCIDTIGEFVLGSGHIVLPESARDILTENYTMEKLWTYLYNSQQKAEILPDKDGNYLVNGEIIKASELVKAPLSNNLQYESTRLFLIPPEFPEPHELEIGTENEKRKFRISRRPHESITEIKFSTVDEGALEFSYVVNDFTINFNFNVNEKKAQSVTDIIFANKVFNAFLSGEGYISNTKIPVRESHNTDANAKDAIVFWETVNKLENILGVKFNPGVDITVGLMNKVKLLQHCFIENMPYKTYETYDNVSGVGYTEHSTFEDLIGKEVYFELTTENSIDLFGVQLKLLQLTGIFNAIVNSHQTPDEKQKGEFCIKLVPKNKSKMYSGNMLFLNDKDLSDFVENKEHIELLRLSKELDIEQ